MSATSLHRSASPLPTPVIDLVLSGELDMEQAKELQRYLTGGIELGGDIVIDLGQVRFIDCVCLGVLIRAAREAHELDRTLSLVNPSELVLMMLRLTEAEDLFVILDGRAAVGPRGRPGGDHRAE